MSIFLYWNNLSRWSYSCSK